MSKLYIISIFKSQWYFVTRDIILKKYILSTLFKDYVKYNGNFA